MLSYIPVHKFSAFRDGIVGQIFLIHNRLRNTSECSGCSLFNSTDGGSAEVCGAFNLELC